MSERALPLHVDRDDVVALRDVVELAERPTTAGFVSPEQLKRARRVIRVLDTYANLQREERA